LNPAKKVIAEHSKFWLGDKFDPATVFSKGSTMDLIALAGYRRAIANFVYILTRRNIPVRFAENNSSLTDGKVVYIGGELSKGAFDSTVGLALHEAMHIVKSDFDLIKTLWGKIPRSLTAAARGRFSDAALGDYAKYVLNVVEDRYIDAWAYDEAVGYRGYYQALYSNYFYLDEISEVLKSADLRQPTLRNYKFRFTNIMNPDSDLDALPALRKISEMLDIENMLRPELAEPKQRLDLAFAITEEIVKSVVEEREKEKQKQHEKLKEKTKDQKGAAEQSDGTPEPDEGEPSEEDPLGGQEASTDPVVDDPNEELVETDDTPVDLTEEEIEKVLEIMERQEKFVMRKLDPPKLSDEVLKKLGILEQAGVGVAIVGGEEGIPEVECVVFENMTKELLESGSFPFASGFGTLNAEGGRGVEEGTAFGTMLGRKLQIRSEVNTTKFSRLLKGKIDRRILSSLGFGSENIFYQTTVDKYKNVHMHVTVDSSGSMAAKWKKTIATVVAMAKATSMLNNVTMSISFRTGGGAYENQKAYIVMAYDSRKDKFSKITELFPYLFPTGSTPEGLTFQAILHKIPPATHELDSYFVNLSDGEPAFSSVYYGETAALHTKKQVNKLRENGVNILSYFIEDDANRQTSNGPMFQTMYGKDAHFIDVESITQVAYTMNQKFLSKEN
jgi:hypothetical protein